jgi:hypothetical protein
MGARLNPDRSIATTFQALPGASFVVNGAAQMVERLRAGRHLRGRILQCHPQLCGQGVAHYQW